MMIMEKRMMKNIEEESEYKRKITILCEFRFHWSLDIFFHKIDEKLLFCQ